MLNNHNLGYPIFSALFLSIRAVYTLKYHLKCFILLSIILSFRHHEFGCYFLISHLSGLLSSSVPRRSYLDYVTAFIVFKEGLIIPLSCGFDKYESLLSSLLLYACFCREKFAAQAVSLPKMNHIGLQIYAALVSNY